MKMTLRTLRDACPGWSFRAERAGRRWEYLGTRGDRTVRIFSVSQLVGSDDLTEVQWRVGDGRTATSFSSWLCANAVE